MGISARKQPRSDQSITIDLIRTSIEKVLLKMGPPEFEIVQSRLRKNYDCDVYDCIQNPQYLKTVLDELYGDASQSIIDSINKELENCTMNKNIENFLKVLTH